MTVQYKVKRPKKPVDWLSKVRSNAFNRILDIKRERKDVRNHKTGHDEKSHGNWAQKRFGFDKEREGQKDRRRGEKGKRSWKRDDEDRDAKPPNRQQAIGFLKSLVIDDVEVMEEFEASPKLRKQILSSMDKVIEGMGDKALFGIAQGELEDISIMSKPQSVFMALPSRDRMILVAQYGQQAKSAIGGFYNPDTKRVFVDGIKMERDTFTELLAHEISHVIDHHANETRWGEIWQREINILPSDLTLRDRVDGKQSYPLSKYATTNVLEGFAEFARLAWLQPLKAKENFPQAWSFFTSKDLLSDKWKQQAKAKQK